MQNSSIGRGRYGHRSSAVCARGVALGAVLSAAAAAEPQAVPVTTSEARTTAIVQEVRLTGTVSSPRVARVSTAVGGLVAQVHVDGGDAVLKDDTLVELDRELAALELRQAEAATREARERLADAERRLTEVQPLLKKQTIPASRVRSLEAEVRINAAGVERLAAEQAHRAERLERHRVRAPFAGVISRKLTEAGEWVEPGTAVAELVAMSGLRIDFQAPQTYFPRIDADTEITVRLDALPEHPLAARVASTIPVSDPDARTFTVRARLADDEVPMTPGMSAHAVVRIDTGRQGVVVPRDALIRYPDGRVVVWLVREQDGAATVTERQVMTGLAFGAGVEIRSGLEAGSEVVVTGNEALREGQKVRPAPM